MVIFNLTYFYIKIIFNIIDLGNKIYLTLNFVIVDNKI